MSIRIKKSHQGLLHRDTRTPAGKPISLKKEEAALHSRDPAERRRAQFAINARKFHHGGK